MFIAVDKFDNYYASNGRGPLYISRDHGSSWDVGMGVLPSGERFSAITAVVTATAPSGAGDVYAISLQTDQAYRPPVGAWRSRDAGATWNPVELTATHPDPVYAVNPRLTVAAVDPFDSARLYAITLDGKIVKTDDVGVNWSDLSLGTGCLLGLDKKWRDVKLNAIADRLWLLTNFGRLLVSRGGGDCTEIPLPPGSDRIFSLAPSRHASDVLFAVAYAGLEPHIWVYRDTARLRGSYAPAQVPTLKDSAEPAEQ